MENDIQQGPLFSFKNDLSKSSNSALGSEAVSKQDSKTMIKKNCSNEHNKKGKEKSSNTTISISIEEQLT